MKVIETRENGTKRVYTKVDKKSKTDQQYKDDTDVNRIMSRFKTTGQIAHLAKNEGKFADVSNIQSLHQSLVTVREAEYAFAQLPAKVRKFFDNDMRNAEKYLADPAGS